MTIVIGVEFVVMGILISGNLATVMGFDVVIIVILPDVDVVVVGMGSSLTHFGPAPDALA